MSSLLSRKQAPDSKGRIQKITPELAGWKYVGFEVYILQSGEENLYQVKKSEYLRNLKLPLTQSKRPN